MSIPLTDPFEPHARHEGVGSARFWPDLLVAELTLPETLGDTIEEMLSQTSPEGLALNAASLHEQVHWLQTVGTTFGRFMSMVRLASSGLAESILATATEDEREALDTARRRGRAPAARGPDGHLLHDLGYSPTLQSLFDHWWACAAFDPILIDARKDLLGPLPLRLLFGLSLRYAQCDGDLKSVFNAPDQDFQTLTEALTPAEAHVPEGVTVREIEEGAAMAAQYISISGTRRHLEGDRLARFDEITSEWLQIRRSDPRHRMYWRAWETYAGESPDTMDRARLDDFLLICDLALCPHVPDRPQKPLRSWSDFHPTLRFQRLVEVARQRPPARPADSPSWWSTRRRQLSRLTNLSDGGRSAAFTTSRRSIDDYVDPTSRMRSFVTQASRNLTSLRRAAQAGVISPFGADDRSIARMEKASARLSGPGWIPPLTIIRDAVITSLPGEDAARVLRAGAARRAVQSWLTHAGPLRFAGISGDADGQDAVDFAQKRLADLFGLQPPTDRTPTSLRTSRIPNVPCEPRPPFCARHRAVRFDRG